MAWTLWTWMLGILCVPHVAAVKITSLDVPRTAWNTVKLNCRYDLEGDKLYAVKWYKDNEEFYRCLDNGNIQEFPLEDIKIYHGESSQRGSCYFELVALSEKSGGEYSCEVSLDWPTFKTVKMSSRLKIVEPSKLVPQFQLESESTERIENENPAESVSKGTTYLASLINLCIPLLLII